MQPSDWSKYLHYIFLISPRNFDYLIFKLESPLAAFLLVQIKKNMKKTKWNSPTNNILCVYWSNLALPYKRVKDIFVFVEHAYIFHSMPCYTKTCLNACLANVHMHAKGFTLISANVHV
jgi:hypothetical protein